MSIELFNQLQYLVNKYFFVITSFQVLFFLAPLFLHKLNNRILKFFPFLIITAYTMTYYSINLFALSTEGWDRKAICKWIEIADSYQNLNIYTVQIQSSLNVEVPMFSSYYHPILLNKFDFFCSLPLETFNYLIVGVFISVATFFTIYFKKIKNSSIIIIVIFAFNNLLWLILTGQFFFLEIFTLIISLIFLKNKSYKLAIFFMFIFGIQKIYLLIFSLYLAYRYFKTKGVVGVILLIISINLLSLDLLPDFISFWFSNDGYLFGNRGSRHSFLQESFGPNNQSLFFLIKDFSEYFSLPVNTLLLLFTVLCTSMFFVYKLYKRIELQVSSTVVDLMVLLALLLIYPLLKPYGFIYFSIILLFLIEELNSSEFESLSIPILALPSLTYPLISTFLFLRPEEVSYFLSLQYRFILSYSFWSSWIVFILAYKLLNKKKDLKLK
jgi:hypothetical protein